MMSSDRKQCSFDDERPYLTHTTQVRIRFEEVDSMNIVWHGRYLSFFDDARRAFGRQYGVDYPAFIDSEVAAPVVDCRMRFLASARLDDVLDVEARLYKTDSAKLAFKYEVRRSGTGEVLVVGFSIQVFSGPGGSLLLAWPPMMVERLDAWRPLWIKPI
jgi:acyl-CoA thioester hydrolase